MRKVSVGLEADVAGFVRPIDSAKKSVDDLGDKVDSLDRSLNKIPPDAAKAGAALKLLSGDVGSVGDKVGSLGEKSTGLAVLDSKIQASRAEVKKLADEFVKTGDVDVFKNLGAAEGQLRGLQDVRKKLAAALVDGARDAGKSAGPSFMASLGIAAAGAAPLLASVLGAAVIGGGGLGLIGLGIIGQVKNPAVKSAFADLGAVAKQSLTSATSAFGPSLVKGAGMLHTELDKISPQLKTMFDRLAPVFEKLLGGGIGLFDRMLPGIDALSRAAGPVLTQLANELPRLGAALSSMFQSISAGAPGAANGLHALFTVVDGLLIAIGKLIQGFEMLPGGMQVALAIVGLLGAAFLYLGPKVLAAKDTFDKFRDSVSDSNSKMGELAKNAGIVAGALAVVQTIAATFGHSDATGIDETRVALDKLAASGEQSSAVTKHLNYDLGTLGTGGMAKTGNAIASFTENLTGLGSVMDESLQHANERISSIDAALAAMVQSGNAEQAAAAFDLLAKRAQEQGVSIDDLKKGLPQYQDALAAAAAESGKAGDAARAAATDYEALGKALNHTAVTADSLAGAMVGKIFTATMGLDQATLGVAESLTKLGQTMDKNGKAIDKHTGLVAMNTEKGQANREGVLAAVTANMQMYQAQLSAGMGAEDAAKNYDDNTAALERQLRKAGLTTAQIENLIGKYKGIPASVDRDIAIHGLTDAINGLADLIRLINGIKNKDVTVTVYYRTKGQSLNAPLAQGGIRRAAVGMIIPPSDPGTTLVGEPQTGGEALIPFQGISQGRAMSLMQQVGAGYGLSVSAGRGGGGGGGASVSVTLYAGDGYTASLLKDLRTEVRTNFGGNVQVALGQPGR